MPELPGCLSQGETRDELRRNVVEAIEACLAVHIEDEGPYLPEKVEKWEIPVSIEGRELAPA